MTTNDAPGRAYDTESLRRIETTPRVDWDRISGYVLLGVFVVATVLGLGLALGSRVVPLGQFVIDFFKSSGFGAVAALVAAGVAYSGVKRQVSLAREQKSSSEWWRMFEWAADRGLSSEGVEPLLPAAVTTATLSALVPRAPSEAEEVLCGELLNHVLSHSREAPQALDPDALSALRHYVKVAEGTSARSPQAEGLLFEAEVARVVGQTSGHYLVSETRPKDLADLVVGDGDARVGVMIKTRVWVADRSRLQAALRASEHPVAGWILILREASARDRLMLDSLHPNMEVIVWSPAQGSDVLREQMQASLTRFLGQPDGV